MTNKTNVNIPLLVFDAYIVPCWWWRHCYSRNSRDWRYIYHDWLYWYSNL